MTQLTMLSGNTTMYAEFSVTEAIVEAMVKEGMDAKQKSNLTGFITIEDTSANKINTPNGSVFFLELVGMTDAELKTLSTGDTVKAVYEKLGTDLTDYHRESVV